ncbi:protein unc-93 homolog A [Musca vetustissima]|uniref:protein unc-93 homolog A n=1 Tax=Musca vetustissima TaxID=27455 RepID=UPI002AB742F9|nr:protein unc-93 homolog A [Musca vetustissima]
MGSLPNLHELEHLERKREKRREREMRERLAREASRERERMQQRKHSSYNPYLMAGLGMGGSMAPYNTAIATGGGAAAAASGGLPVGGAALLSYGLGTGHKHHGHQHPHHYRHSLTNRHRVLRTRSSGATHNVWDDQVLEHLPAYSPISTRSHRVNPVSSYHVQAALAASRRRESINSSIGATSIRRLISLNNRNCRYKVPAHIRQKVTKCFTLLALAHGLMCAVLVPIFALQGSNSVWHHREQWLQIGPNIGSLLLSICLFISAGMSLVTPKLIRKFGYTVLMGVNSVAVCLFLICHLYPSIYTLLPAYMILGLTHSPSWISKIAVVVHFGSKLSCSQHECTLMSSHALDSWEEHKLSCNRDQKVRRLGRWFQASKDIGIILGAIIASMVLSCTSPNNTLPQAQAVQFYIPSTPYVWSRGSPYKSEYYNLDEHGSRICGADMCPLWQFDAAAEDDEINETIFSPFIREKPRAGSSTLIGIYLIFALISIILLVLAGKVHATFRHERIKGMTDTLLFAGPLAYFIGTEQAYILSDFLTAFVSCSLGISMVAGAIIGMGVMQLIVSCTLSMLLRHTKRIVVILAGFFFHSCLLLALSTWKPSSDDSALFYVLAASWGACNGMWETLLLALVTLNHTNHVVEVTSPLQALRFLGLGITFAAHGYMCETPKIISLVIMLVVSVLPYAMLEIRLESQRKAQLISL